MRLFACSIMPIGASSSSFIEFSNLNGAASHTRSSSQALNRFSTRICTTCFRFFFRIISSPIQKIPTEIGISLVKYSHTHTHTRIRSHSHGFAWLFLNFCSSRTRSRSLLNQTIALFFLLLVANMYNRITFWVTVLSSCLLLTLNGVAGKKSSFF